MLVTTLNLARYSAIALDLETTGLDVRSDRVLQIGAVPVKKPEQTAFDCLVNPGIPIPPRSTEIHSITSEIVAAAAQFSDVFPKLEAVLEDKLLIGFNTGFDLAILEAECKRADIMWQWAGALCVRELSHLALGQEKAHLTNDLETLAHHFGIETTGRHSATGDARMTAQIFMSLLPLLQDKGIVTLADAYFHLSYRHQWRRNIVEAGWVDILKNFGSHAPSEAIRSVDTYPFRHQIGELMNQPPIILPETAPAYEAASIMQQNHIDCVFVGSPGDIKGIVSERDILKTMAIPLDKIEKARSMKLHEIMSSPLITAHDYEYLYVALGRITRHDIRHLGVLDQKGSLIGWLSARELLRHRTSAALILDDHIQSAATRSDLDGALSVLPSVAERLIAEKLATGDITAIISGEIKRLLARAAQFSEQEMIKNGHGPAPGAHSVLILGSAARSESLLAGDQDHAIIYDLCDGADPNTAQNWFLLYGKRISDILANAGLPYCTGGVMSQNPSWCMSLPQWRRRLNTWVKKARPDDTLAMDIFFDFEHIEGSSYLAHSLREICLSPSVRSPAFLKNLARNVRGIESNLDIWGRIKFSDGRFDAKRAITLPITEAIRVLALSHGLDMRRSIDRATALSELKNMPRTVVKLAEDLIFTQGLILKQQLADLSSGQAAKNSLASDYLKKEEKKELARIIRNAALLPELIKDALFSGA